MAKAQEQKEPATSANAQATAPNNLSLWEQVQQTDPNYTKTFNRAGGFRGTATNATYLAKRATEMFGPCGTGWGVKVIDEQIVEGHPFVQDGVVIGHAKVHVVRVQLWYMLNGQRGEIEQFGQTEMVGRRNDGKFFTDEEAPKKSITDGMSKCLSLLGFAADIHLGLYDDSKYVNDLRAQFANSEEPEPEQHYEEAPPRQQPQRANGSRMSVDQHVKAMKSAESEAALKRAFALAWKQYEDPSNPRTHTAAQTKLKEVYDGCLANFQAPAVGVDGADNVPVDNFEDSLQ